ncbi:MAG: hypothetical protein ABIY70_21840 [Capsulimonas sp.]|uniref:hypothetical protein n=1 Tax=Capsulimonas sp. TaxID=2494211 RepID=UPI003266D5B4
MDNNFVLQDQSASAQADAARQDIQDWETPSRGAMYGNWVVNGYMGALFAVAAAAQILSTLALK